MGCSGNCGGCCGSCGGCARQLVIAPKELEFLEILGQVAFLPVARKTGDPEPVYLEEGVEKQGEYSLLLQCLEKKGLISLSYDKPLGGEVQTIYAAYPIHGSISLTERGYNVLETLEYYGIPEEN